MNMTLEQMRDLDVKTVDPATLVDMQTVTVNTSLPREERILDYISQIINPYCFKFGNTVVKIGHTDTEFTMEDRLEKYLLSL